MPGLDFSGDTNAKVTFGNPAHLDNLAQGAYMCWVKGPPSVAQADGAHGLFWKGLFAQGVNGLIIADSVDGRLGMTRVYSGTNLQCTADGFVTTDDYQFLGCSWDDTAGASSQLLYRGTLTSPPVEPGSYSIQTASSGTKNDDSGVDLLVGNRTTNLLREFKGILYWVAVWDTYQDMAAAIRQWRRPRVTAGCVLWSRLGMHGLGAGSQIDLSGRANHGTEALAAIGTVGLPIGPFFGLSGGGAPVAVAVSGQTVTPSPIGMSLGVQAPAVSVGAVGVTPTPIGMALGIQAPAVAAGPVTATPSPIPMTMGLQAPAVSVGAVAVNPSPIPMVLGIQAPAINTGAVAVAPTPIPMALAVKTPAVALGAATVNPSPITMALAVKAPAAFVGAVGVSPTPIVMVLGIQSPSVTAAGVQTVTPTPIPMILVVQGPGVSTGGVTISPAAIAMALSLQAPAVAVGAVSVSPTPIPMTMGLRAPAITIGPITVSPNPIPMQLLVVSPLVVGGQILAAFSGTLHSLAPFHTGKILGLPAHSGIIVVVPAHTGELRRNPN